jgi:hypothetical protein
MISQIMANVGPAPAEAIPGIIGQLEQLRSQASAEEQAAVDYIIAKLRSRGAAQ